MPTKWAGAKSDEWLRFALPNRQSRGSHAAAEVLELPLFTGLQKLVDEFDHWEEAQIGSSGGRLASSKLKEHCHPSELPLHFMADFAPASEGEQLSLAIKKMGQRLAMANGEKFDPARFRSILSLLA